MATYNGGIAFLLSGGSPFYTVHVGGVIDVPFAVAGASVVGRLMQPGPVLAIPPSLESLINSSPYVIGRFAVPILQSYYDALTSLTPVAPSLAIFASAATITLGGSVVLSWYAVGATSLTASGSWSGSQIYQGSAVVTPVASGNNTYTLTAAYKGASTTVSVTVNVLPLIGNVAGTATLLGAPVGRTVVVVDAALGTLLGIGTSNPTTGAFSININTTNPVVVTGLPTTSSEAPESFLVTPT